MAFDRSTAVLATDLDPHHPDVQPHAALVVRSYNFIESPLGYRGLIQGNTMATPVILPKAGNSVESCIIQTWHKNIGDAVAEGDVVCEVATDKPSWIIAPVLAAVSPLMTKHLFYPIAAIGDAGENAGNSACWW